MNVRSEREPLVSLRPYVALLVLSVGCLFAQSSTDWLTRAPIPHKLSGFYCASDMVLVRRPESTFVFLCVNGDSVSYINAYCPQRGTWSGDLSSLPRATNIALAYARDAMRMYAIGYFPQTSGNHNRFYTYVFDSPSGSSGTWSSEVLPFSLDPDDGGTMMTYRRNRDLAPLYAIPGWLYAAAGSWKNNWLWRYPIPHPGDAAVDGYSPGDTAVIADATPHFVWPSIPGALEYRIKVSSESLLSTAELDTVTVDTTFQVPETSPLTNGQHYWQTSYCDSLGNWTAGSVLQFTLTAGWERIDSIPLPGLDPWLFTNMTLNYTCKGPTWPKQESLWVTTGSIWAEQMYVYSIHDGTWSTFPLKHGCPYRQYKNDMMASAPSDWNLEESKQVYAVLDTTDTTEGHHWKIDLAAKDWVKIDVPFPGEPGYYARLVFDAELDTLYATAGEDTNLFFARCPGSGDGQQADTNGPLSPGLTATARGGVVSIRYSLSAPERARLDVFDPVGRKVLSRDIGEQSTGEHYEQVTQSALGAHAGILLLRLTHGTTTERAKVVVF